jgi:hypothetical protein
MTKAKIKKFLIIAITILFILFIILECRLELDIVKYDYKASKFTENLRTFAYPFVNREITNDTFFTIAIGNNILKNGITNLDTLTWHENLSFPHSRSV